MLLSSLAGERLSVTVSSVSLSWSFDYPLKWKTCNVYIEGKVLERLLPGKWLSGVRICNSSIHFLCYPQLLLRRRSGGLCADGLRDLEQPQLYEDLISTDSPVSAHAHQEGKLTVWQLAISIRAKCTSSSITCFCMGSKRAVWHEPVSSLSIWGPRTVVVGFEIQINCYISGAEGLPVSHMQACWHCMHLANSCCTSGGGEKWLPASAVKQIPPPPFQIWHWIQPDPAHNTHKCEHPDGLAVCRSELQINRISRLRQNKTVQRLASTCTMG